MTAIAMENESPSSSDGLNAWYVNGIAAAALLLAIVLKQPHPSMEIHAFQFLSLTIAAVFYAWSIVLAAKALWSEPNRTAGALILFASCEAAVAAIGVGFSMYEVAQGGSIRDCFVLMFLPSLANAFHILFLPILLPFAVATITLALLHARSELKREQKKAREAWRLEDQRQFLFRRCLIITSLAAILVLPVPLFVYAANNERGRRPGDAYLAHGLLAQSFSRRQRMVARFAVPCFRGTSPAHSARLCFNLPAPATA